MTTDEAACRLDSSADGQLAALCILTCYMSSILWNVFCWLISFVSTSLSCKHAANLKSYQKVKCEFSRFPPTDVIKNCEKLQMIAAQVLTVN